MFDLSLWMMHYEGENCEPKEPQSLTDHKQGGGREHVLVVHDESVIHSNDGCVSAYGEDGKRQGATKGMGPSIMIGGVLSDKTGRIAFRSKAEWNKFRRDHPQAAGVIHRNYEKRHGKTEGYHRRMLLYGVQSANIIINPGKVVLLQGEGRGGREGGEVLQGEEVFAARRESEETGTHNHAYHTHIHNTEPR